MAIEEEIPPNPLLQKGGGESARNWQITPLGTRGWIPHEGRQTACILAQMEGRNFLFDSGSGLSRLLDDELRSRLHDGPLHILLSHYHLDHVIGLSWLRGIFEHDDRPVHLYGPGAELVESGLKSAMQALIGAPLFGEELESFSQRVHLHEVNETAFQIDGVSVELLPLQHTGGSVAIKLGGEVVYLTDTFFFDAIAPFVCGTQLLLGESHWLDEASGRSHCGIEEMIEVARNAAVPSLMPIHFGPSVSELEIGALERKSDDNLRIWVANEGETVHGEAL